MKNLWRGKSYDRLNPLQQLVQRSRIIGYEPKLCVWGGGNTSTKLKEKDFRGNLRRVLRVKGSGSDLKSCKENDFTPLDLELVLLARRFDAMSDDQMVRYLASCQLNPQAPRASIEALLHAFVPHTHIDHTHADAILAVTNQKGGRRLAQKLFGNDLVWVPYVKPGFTLAKRVGDLVDRNPAAKGVILQKHGLITWGATSKESYSRTINYVTTAERHFSKVVRRQKPTKSPKKISPGETRSKLLELLPVMRRVLGRHKRVILKVSSKPDVMRYLQYPRGKQISQAGPATPDHMLRTKRIPLWLNFPQSDPRRLSEKSLVRQMEAYALNHERTFQKLKEPGMYMLDPYPKVILIPGLGMVTSGKDLREANIVAEVYRHSMQVQLDADACSKYESLSVGQQFEMEYWDMELAKLAKQPKDRELARRVVLITGACGAIGQAMARKFIEEGAHVVVSDLRGAAAQTLAKDLNATYGKYKAMGFGLDVRRLSSVRQAIEKTVLTFGGLDVIISNAGVAHIAAIDKLDPKMWEGSLSVNATGHFLISREAIPYLRRQGTGGSMIFITTKNVLAPGKDFGAYSASKAAQAQLARIIAIENGDAGIRSNMINPDGIFDGSGLWSKKVRSDRAASYGIPKESLEDFYRKRNLLKRRVLPEDVAEAGVFLAGERSSKTTGCILTVDGGLREAFPR